MSRNVTFLIVILIVVVLAAYLVWLRGQISAPVTESPAVSASITPSESPMSLSPTPASSSATPSASKKPATASGIPAQ